MLVQSTPEPVEEDWLIDSETEAAPTLIPTPELGIPQSAPDNFVDDLVPPCDLPIPLFPSSPLAPFIHLDSLAPLVPHRPSAPSNSLTPSSSRPSGCSSGLQTHVSTSDCQPFSFLALCSLSSAIIHHHSGSTGLPYPSGSTLASHHPGFAVDFWASGCASTPLASPDSSFPPAPPWSSLLSALPHSARPLSPPRFH